MKPYDFYLRAMLVKSSPRSFAHNGRLFGHWPCSVLVEALGSLTCATPGHHLLGFVMGFQPNTKPTCYCTLKAKG